MVETMKIIWFLQHPSRYSSSFSPLFPSSGSSSCRYFWFQPPFLLCLYPLLLSSTFLLNCLSHWCFQFGLRALSFLFQIFRFFFSLLFHFLVEREICGADFIVLFICSVRVYIVIWVCKNGFVGGRFVGFYLNFRVGVDSCKSAVWFSKFGSFHHPCAFGVCLVGDWCGNWHTLWVLVIWCWL